MASRYRRGDAFTTAPVGRVLHPHGNQVTDQRDYSFTLLAIPKHYCLFRLNESQEWEIFGQMNFIELTNILKDLATHVNLAVFMSHPRGPKKHRRKFKRIRPSQRPHVSTAKILSQNKTQKRTP